MNKVKYFRRRQFAFGPEYFSFEGWRRVKVAEGYYLTVHPDLPVHEVRSANKSITLLGYMIDPYRQESNEAEILSKMLVQINGVDDVVAYLERISGRFVIIVELGDEMWIFHDASGLRQVVYCRDENRRVWCASQAGTLAERLGFSLDQEVLEYRNAPMFRNSSNFWLVNNRSPYKEVLQLLPNHYLDLHRGESIRFWPKRNCISSLSVKEGVRLSAPILKNSIEAACKKFDLKMGITSGIDSRITLAATKEVSDKIHYFTIADDQNRIDFVDVKVPAKLLPKLGITHHVLERRSMSEDFRKYHEGSATLAREDTGKVAYSLFCQFGTDFTVLNSNVSENSQYKYWVPRSKIDGEGLAIITGRYHPLAIREYDKWIQGARGACEESGLNIMELLYWEQKMGRWAASSFGEYDVVYETFTPYNNRLLNMLLMGISERYRRDRMWYVPIRQIQHMWPEVLSEPIQPAETLEGKLLRFVRRLVLHKYVTPWVPIYEYFRFWMYKRRAKLGVE